MIEIVAYMIVVTVTVLFALAAMLVATAIVEALFAFCDRVAEKHDND